MVLKFIMKRRQKLTIIKKWPELGNLLHPKALEIQQTEKSKKLVAIAQKEDGWSKMTELKNEIVRIEEERFITEKYQVLAMRLKRELENVFLKEKLYAEYSLKVSDYDKITDLENLVLGKLEIGR